MNEKSQLSRMGFVLAGGRSSRMGADKAFLKLDGRTLLESALSVVRSVTGEAAIVGDRDKYAAHGKVIDDIYPRAGPLAGIHAALVGTSAELNLILAVDLPFVSAELLTFLLDCAENTEAVVTLPRSGGRLQPLCAVYRRGFAAFANEALKEGKNKIDPLFSRAPTRIISETELRTAGFAEKLFSNLNTPEDVQAATNNLQG